MRYLSTVLLAVLLNACPQAPRGKGMVPNHEITGVYSFGTPVRGASVGLYLDAALTNEFVQTTTREDGHFSLSFLVQENDGPFWLCTSGGSFVDPQSAVPISLSDYRACRYLEEPPEQPVPLTPNINLAMVLARARGGPLANAFPEAVANFNGFSGCAGDAGLLGVIPIDPTAAAESDLSPGLLAGILLSGASAQAQQISLQLNYTPGVRITPVTLWRGWEADLSDTILDGKDHAGPIEREGYAFTADSFRGGPLSYVQGVRRFLESDRNTTSVTVADMRPILDCMTSYTGEPLVGSVGSSAGLVDVATPIVNFLTPGEGDVLSSQAPVAILAMDTSAITRLEFSQDQPHITADAAELNGTSAKLRGTVDVAGLANGELEICTEAEDEVGNVGTGCLTVQVDTEAPIFDHLEPSSGSFVRGSVAIKVTASDPHGLASLELLSPPSLDVDVAFNTTEAELTATWDTTLAADGDAVVRVQAKDLQGHIADASLALEIDNNRLGKLHGTVALADPITGATVQPFAFTSQEPIGEPGITAADGTFTVGLPDNYTGWILLVASGTSAEYHSPLTGRPVRFRFSDELTAAIFYEPTAQGTAISDFQVHGLTHLATRRAQSMENPEANIDRSYFLIGEHADTSAPIDLRYTPVSDITSETILDNSESSQRLAIVHLAIARWCGEAVIAEGLALSALDLLACLRLFEKDLEGDGVLDGIDASGAQIYATSSDLTPLSANTLRFHAANAGRRWLANIELAPDLPGINSTGLAADSFSGPGGLFWGMSENASELFGGQPPLSFDQIGPTITEAVFLPAKERDPPIYRGVIALRVSAEDPSNIASITAVVAGAPAAVGEDQMPGYHDRAYFPLDTTGLAPGEHTVTVSARDAVGNVSTIHLPVIVDNTPPVLQLAAEQLVTSTTHTVSGTVDDGTEVVRLQVYVSDRLRETIPSPSRDWAVDVEIPCNATTGIEVRAVDVPGNETTASYIVSCDAFAPSVQLQESSYWPASDLELTYAPDGSSIDYTNNPETERVELHRANWCNPCNGGSPTCVIKKYFNRLDDSADNPAILKFSGSDSGLGAASVQSSEEQLQIDYRFFIAGVQKRDWTPQAYPTGDGGDVAGRYEIPIAYQTLHPAIAFVDATTPLRIDVRVTDLAGLSSTRSFHFFLEVYAPPAAYVGCGLNADVQRLYRMDDKTMHLLYTSVGDVPFVRGQLVWSLDLPSDSMAPNIPFRATFADPSALISSRREMFAGQPHTTTESGGGACSIQEGCECGAGHYGYILRSRCALFGCHPITCKDVEPGRPGYFDTIDVGDPPDVPIPWVPLHPGVPIPHDTYVTVANGSIDEHSLDADTLHPVTVGLRAPRLLTLINANYTWPSQDVTGHYYNGLSRTQRRYIWEDNVKVYTFYSEYGKTEMQATFMLLALRLTSDPVEITGAEAIGLAAPSLGVYVDPSCSSGHQYYSQDIP